MRERDGGGRWRERGEENQMEEQGGLSKCEKERESAHTPFCALSGQTHPHMVGVSVLWSSDRRETQRHTGLQPALGGDITCRN